MQLEDFLAQEQSLGKTVAEDATFTLNPAEVRSRVATFCDEDRLYPLWRCLQAITRLSHSDLFLHSTSDGCRVRFLWPGAPPLGCLRNLLLEGTTEGFDAVDSTASQHLFFGLSAALGAGNYRLRLVTPGGGVTLQEGQLALLEERSENFCELTFAIDTAWWQRLVPGGRGVDPDSWLSPLRARLGYCSRPVHLDGARLEPRLPQPPSRPWASRLASGSNLAWRYIGSPVGSLVRAPEVTLDRYRVGKGGYVWHLVQDDPQRPHPMSIQFADLTMRERPLSDEGDGQLCGGALFLTLEAGRQDWLFPVRDGVLTQPVPITLTRGGVLVLTADSDLRYDLSGLKVIDDQRLHEKLPLWEQEAKAMKAMLRLSIANTTVRAEAMPNQFYQASGYAFGGPLAGLLAGQFGPMLHRWRSRKRGRGPG